MSEIIVGNHIYESTDTKSFYKCHCGASYHCVPTCECPDCKTFRASPLDNTISLKALKAGIAAARAAAKAADKADNAAKDLTTLWEGDDNKRTAIREPATTPVDRFVAFVKSRKFGDESPPIVCISIADYAELKYLFFGRYRFLTVDNADYIVRVDLALKPREMTAHGSEPVSPSPSESLEAALTKFETRVNRK